MSGILSWSAVAWGLALAVFTSNPGGAAAKISGQTSSTTPALGAPVELSPTLQPLIIGNFSYAFAGGSNSAVITPDKKYLYVLVNTYQIGPPPSYPLTAGNNKILTYRINGDGTVTGTVSPEDGQGTTGTSLYLANNGLTLFTVDLDGSSDFANIAPFEAFTVNADGSLSPVPNTIQLPAPMTVLSTVGLGPQAADGSGQYFYTTLIDNEPSDSGYLTTSVLYTFKIAPDGTLKFVFPFSLVNPQQPIQILNILANEKFVYVFGDSGAYVAAIGANGVPQPPVRFTAYNDNNFFGYAFFGMQISPDGQDFYAVDSTDGSLNSLGICHYPISGDGAIQFPSTNCQNILSNVPSGESFGAFGLYISPDNKFLYSLFQTALDGVCNVSMYAYTINSNGSLSALEFAPNPPLNSVPIGNNFCGQSFIAATPDGSHLYALGATGTNTKNANNAIVPFAINKGLTATAFTITSLIAHVRELKLTQVLERRLMATLVPAQHNLAAGHLGAACGTLGAFISTVDARNGKKIYAADAAKLIAEATAISESVGCRRRAPNPIMRPKISQSH
jgi:hypothetical protein